MNVQKGVAMSAYLEGKLRELRGRDFLVSEDDEMLEEYFLGDSNPEADSSLEVGEDSNLGMNSDLEEYFSEDSNSEMNPDLEEYSLEDSNSEMNPDLEEYSLEDSNSEMDFYLEVSKDSNLESNFSIGIGKNSTLTPEVFDNGKHNLRKGREYLQTDEGNSSSALEFTEDLNFGSQAFDNDSPGPKKGREYLDESGDSYPKITYLSDKKFLDAANIESKYNYFAAGTTLTVSFAGVVSLYTSLVSQLRKSIGSSKLANEIVNYNLRAFLLMNKESLMLIKGIGKVRADKTIDFYKTFISAVTVVQKSTNLVTDLLKSFYEPNHGNLMKLPVDSIDVVGTLYSFNPLAPLATIPVTANAVYLAHQCKYAEATVQVAMAYSYVLPCIMKTDNPSSLVILGLTGISVSYNLWTSLNDYMNDKGGLNSKIAYKYLYQSLSKTPIASLNDFASNKVQEYNISISKIEKENIESYFSNKGEFGKHLYKHIYSLVTKYIKIELSENEVYQICVEFKDDSLDHENYTYYNCYNPDIEEIARVVIGEDGGLISVDTIYES